MTDPPADARASAAAAPPHRFVPGRRAEYGGARPNIVGVHLYLRRADGRILLGLRHPDVAYAGGSYHFLAGHCEDEGALGALIREAEEEAGLTIAAEDVELVHTVHLLHPGAAGGPPRIQLVFRAHAWSGVPEIREPDKCLEWSWQHPADLPEPIVPYARAAIEAIGRGEAYSEMGWG
ncbi:NUDIX domain-containing protein [Streptomyces sp. Isolate_45]|uniref:NUDIX hydrolase n=1 Tax=Streptomyces sp. Isolate_45 TaxID=2950111 RepID=UPI002481EA1B|nr:NUDIX domain-containing protein [Streptomyces sp. Isolate_45]MDA5279301.1 NUDIX domain-containing protein [Streptomyces sp. Isolate_45]